MGGTSLRGRVVRATDLAPLVSVPIRLHGPATAFVGLPRVQTIPVGRQITWTRQLSGFAGNRWECWIAHVQRAVPDMSWEQFRDGALLHNPSLAADHVFRANQTYLLPEEGPTQIYTWTRQITNFGGSRWDCWTKYVQNHVRGLTWEQFRDDALAYNPQLNADGRLFQPDKAYLIPENTTAPRAYITTRTDAQGGYFFDLPDRAAPYEIQIEVDEYARFVLPLVINGTVTQPIALVPQPNDRPAAIGSGRSGSVRSARTDYVNLPDPLRRVIDAALFMLGDDAQVFNALPPDFQRMCFGYRFLADPNHLNYKDLVCADVVSIVLKAAGFDPVWPSNANPHMADYYHPDRSNAQLIEITNPNDWLPGDILVYGHGARIDRAEHVNVYVGPFVGIDRSGRNYQLSEGNDVIEGSLDFRSQGREIGTGVIGVNLGRCWQAKRGYAWVRHVRLRALAAAAGR